MAKPSPQDEFLIHQIPELLPNVVAFDSAWRESYFFDIHDPSAEGDVAFMTWGSYPVSRTMDSLILANIGGERVRGRQDRPYGDDPSSSVMAHTRVEVVEPWKEVRLWADPDVCAVGIDATFKARTQPYGLRRGTMRAGHEIIWDQSHILQSGVYSGTITTGGQTQSIDGWIGQRDHSWGIRKHGRCPLWMWFQIQLDDGFFGVWHWELENGAHIYTDGCWAPSDGSDPIPVIDFRYDVDWVDASGAKEPYGTNGETVYGIAGTIEIVLADRRKFVITASGRFAAPYEPARRGGLNVVKVQTDDGRKGTAVYEVTGARHHRFFPDTILDGLLPY